MQNLAALAAATATQAVPTGSSAMTTSSSPLSALTSSGNVCVYMHVRVYLGPPETASRGRLDLFPAKVRSKDVTCWWMFGLLSCCHSPDFMMIQSEAAAAVRGCDTAGTPTVSSDFCMMANINTDNLRAWLLCYCCQVSLLNFSLDTWSTMKVGEAAQYRRRLR